MAQTKNVRSVACNDGSDLFNSAQMLGKNGSRPSVRIAEGGGARWRRTTHSEAAVFIAEVKWSTTNEAKAKQSPTRKRLLPSRSLSVFKEPSEDLFSLIPCCRPQLTDSTESTRSSRRCKASDLVGSLELERDAFVERYGGRLLGGAAEGSNEEGEDFENERIKAAYKNQERLIGQITIFDGLLDGGQYLPIFYMLKDEFFLSPVNISLATGMFSLPFVLKPAVAMMSDGMPICGRKRTPYLVASMLIIAGSYAAASVVSDYSRVLACLTLNTLGRCCMSAVLQGMVVEVGRTKGHEPSTRLVGDFFLYKTCGALVSALGTSLLLARTSHRKVLRLGAGVPLLMLLSIGHLEANGGEVSLALSEEAGSADRLSQETAFKWPQFVDTMRNPGVWGPLLSLMAYNAGPNYDDSLYFFYIDRLKFKPAAVGRLRMAQEVAKLVGIAMYRYCLRNVPDQQLMVGLTAVSCPLYLTPLLLTTGAYKHLPVSPQILAVSGELIREVVMHVQILPVYARWVTYCPQGLEGTVMSCLISTMQMSRVVSKLSSAATTSLLGVTATNFDNLSLLVVVCAGFCLMPLPITGVLPEVAPCSTTAAELEDDEAAVIDNRDRAGDGGLGLGSRIVPAG
eukprot:TRINITY_DN4609_c0_g3_i1.p1 TRINITY_DN4609_c0_g3~~TRINITY_DN4609_c0_g3_i1.p1  ORF type:complete len:624 (-),score=80.62 TRINITY_DN4609_c0_g3_i1:209-2080(-)